jgi:hypothetical protein
MGNHQFVSKFLYRTHVQCHIYRKLTILHAVTAFFVCVTGHNNDMCY